MRAEDRGKVGRELLDSVAGTVSLPFSAIGGNRTQKQLANSLWIALAFNLAVLWNPWPWFWFLKPLGPASVSLAAALAMAWRASRLPRRERTAWLWCAVAATVWSAGPITALALPAGGIDFDLRSGVAAFIFAAAGLPLLVGVSGTRDTESTPTVLLLDLSLLAIVLTLLWVRIFSIGEVLGPLSPIMNGLYLGELALIALAAVTRMLTWTSLEERRRIQLLGASMGLLVPIQLGMSDAIVRWRLPSGNPLEVVWSVPFLIAGWQSLHLPVGEPASLERRQLNRVGLLLDSLSPLFITTAVFILACLVARQHGLLAFLALGLAILLQSLHAALAQVNVHRGQRLLLERERQLERANQDLERLSMEDPLTGLANRRRFDQALEECWKRAARRREDFSVLMIDLDHFKAINDLHGHAYGDQCLIEIARVLAQQANRPDDLVARYGGEEFVVLLPETGQPGALTVANRLRGAVWARNIRHEGSPFGQRLTVSVGVGSCLADPEGNAARLVAAADQALYQAKHEGRNRCAGLMLEAETAPEPAAE